MIAGTFVLVPCEPAYDRIEGAWLQSGRYVALHRVAVSPDFRRRGVASALCDALAEVERERIQTALDLAGEVNADYLGLCRAAALLAPWHKADLLNGVEMRDLTLTAQVEAVVQRSYHADG